MPLDTEIASKKSMPSETEMHQRMAMPLAYRNAPKESNAAGNVKTSYAIG